MATKEEELNVKHFLACFPCVILSAWKGFSDCYKSETISFNLNGSSLKTENG